MLSAITEMKWTVANSSISKSEFGFNSEDYRQPQNQRPLFHLMRSHQIC